MAKSNNSSSIISDQGPKNTVPRAVIHKQILEVAESQPEAPVEVIAEEVTGANLQLVKKVFDEYGDPGQAENDQSETTGTAECSTEPDHDDQPHEYMPDKQDIPEDNDRAETKMGSNETFPDPEALTDTQLETLKAIHNSPNATQKELSSQFNVTAASICQRVSSIKGFDWSERQKFTEELFDSPAGTSEVSQFQSKTGLQSADAGKQTEPEPDKMTEEKHQKDVSGIDEKDEANSGGDKIGVCECTGKIKTLAAQIDQLDQRLAEHSQTAAGEQLDPDLVHKVVHACVKSDQISEDEELEILRTLMRTNS